MPKIVTDPTNNPQIVKIGVKSSNIMMQLPRDVVIIVNGKKIIAESKILDGVTVFERILREPYSIDLEFTVRQLAGEQGDVTENKFSFKSPNYVFPQSYLANMVRTIWERNSILDIENTYINHVFGIFEVVAAELPSIETIRGSKNVTVKMSLKENYYSNQEYGNTLIVQ